MMLVEFNLDSLLSRQKKIKPEIAFTIWQEFVKWTHYVFEQERHISFGRIGNYGYKIEEKSGKKIPFLFITDTFLKENYLVSKYHTLILKPVMKINYQAVGRHL
jgi:hypothetical protein